MIIEAGKLQGFLSFIDETVDFRQGHILLVAGINGDGKSSLLESIPWCFWGKGRGKSMSDYINSDSENARVEIILIQDGVRYKKIRQCGKLPSVNELYVDTINKDLESANWRLISDDTKRKTDASLTEILGLSYDIFANSVFFGQKEASSFIEGSASDRKELLCNLLGIEIYEKAEDECRDQANEIDSKINVKTVVLNDKLKIVQQREDLQERFTKTKSEIKTIKKNLDGVNEKLAELQKEREKINIEINNKKKDDAQLIDVNTQIKAVEDRKQQMTDDLEKTSIDLEDIIDEGISEVQNLQKAIENKENLEKEQITCKKAIDELSQEKSKIPALKDSLTAQRTSKENLIQKRSELNTNISTIEVKAKKIRTAGAVCPITDEPCDKLNEDNKTAMLANLNKEINSYNKKLEKITKDLEFTAEKIIEVDGKISAINKKVDSEGKLISKLSNIERDLEKVKEAEEKLPKIKVTYRTKVDKLNEQKTKLEKRLIDIDAEYKTLVNKRKELIEKISTDHEKLLEKVNKQISANKEDLTELQEQQKQAMIAFGQVENALTQVKDATDQAKQIQDQIDKLKRDHRIYTELSIAFGKNGIQKQIISNVVPLLEASTNTLLSKFTNKSDFSVKFDLDPMTKSGKFKKQGGLDIIISQNGQEPRLLNMYSGGETVRIVFAILLSLSNLLTSRAGKKSQTLIIDERVAALDEEGINQFIGIVKYIANQYKKIIIVSHINQLKDAFNEQIVVSKDKRLGSKVEYITG